MATINIDLTNPVNVVKVMVGDVDSCNPIMSDMMYQQILDMHDVGGRSECSLIWVSSIYAAGLILAQYAPDAMRQRERVNSIEIDFDGSSRFRSYERLIKWLKNNPPNTCETDSAYSLFYFGGTYTECNQIYSLRYINTCLSECWGCFWENGYYSTCDSSCNAPC